MRITGMKINSGRGKSILNLKTTNNSLRINSLIGVVYKEKEYCFKVDSIEVKENEQELIITACETGYYNLFSRVSFSDYREILQLYSYLITDEQKIKQIEEESRYC